MGLKELYGNYRSQLQTLYGPGEAAVMTDWLFEKVAGTTRGDLLKNPGAELPTATKLELEQCLLALLRHEPIQYVLGEAWFCNMKLIVNKEVLVPRPETEELVQMVIQHLTGNDRRRETHPPRAKENLSVLDIGTGSGCIAIALRKHVKFMEVLGIDVSAGALEVARANAAAMRVPVSFSQFDFLDESAWGHLPLFDIIVSNPPYIPLNERGMLSKNVVDYEPYRALFVPENAPMLFYEKIASFGKTHLRPGGRIYVEVHENFARLTADVFKTAFKTEIHQDLQGKERIVVALTRKAEGGGPA